MNTIKFTNFDLANIYQMLENMDVSGYKNKRGKGKLQRNIKAKYEEYMEDLKTIQDEHFEKDEDGEFKKVLNAQGQQTFVWLDEVEDNPEKKKLANEATKELADEMAIISVVENETKIKAFYNAIIEDEFETKEGFKDEPFDIMMDALEETFENNKEDE